MEDLQGNLIAYGTHLLASQLGRQWPPADEMPPGSLAEEAVRGVGAYDADARLRLAREIVRDTSLESGLQPRPRAEPVVSVFRLLKPRPRMGRDADKESDTGDASPSPEPLDASQVWDGFWDALVRLSDKSQFDTFFYLLARYGRDVAGTLASGGWSDFEYGISVFEQFKAVAALGHCLDPMLDEGQSIGLVAGDLPGIQQVLYTLTSRGAAKTLRGRSAYLQLLADAVVRYVLQDLGLPWANVVFNAGGNFVLLVPGSKGAEVDRLAREINRKLLGLHRGELHVALAHVEMAARLVVDASHRLREGTLAWARRDLRKRLVQAKDAAFADLLEDMGVYDTVFASFGQGGPAYTGGEQGNLCAICQTEISREQGTQVAIPSEDQEPGLPPDIEMVLCQQCHSLGSHRVKGDQRLEILPYQLARAAALFVEYKEPVELDRVYVAPDGGSGNPPWDAALETLGFGYRFLRPREVFESTWLQGRQGHLLHLKPKTFDVGSDPGIVYGFWPLTTLTPWRNEEEDEIRDFHVMAGYDATGVKRYGVLRMDVDNLGRILLGDVLTCPDLIHLSALSAALNNFFGGELERICRQAVANWRCELGSLDKPGDPPEDDISDDDRKLPYIIYAGGDDLFIVGAWDVLPLLAQEIRSSFRAHTHDRLTTSAGIGLAYEKYPLYKSAEDAGAALDQAKTSPGKDALTLLGKTLDWASVDDARGLAVRLAELVKQGIESDGRHLRAPHALLSMLGYIAYLYHEEASSRESGDSDSVALGHWLWALHYGLRQLGGRVRQPLRREIYDVAQELVLDIGDLETARTFRRIRYLGLAARWAEYLIRRTKKGENR